LIPKIALKNQKVEGLYYGLHGFINGIHDRNIQLLAILARFFLSTPVRTALGAVR
jgi:hypothetical protein